MPNTQWHEVTTEHCCPICNKARRCKLSPDGKAVCCFGAKTAPVGWRIVKDHEGEGATFCVDDGSAVKAPRSAPKLYKPPMETPLLPTKSDLPRLRTLSPEELDAAYQALIGELELSTLNRIDLRKRGLTNETIAERQYCSMPFAQRKRIAAELAGILGDDFASVPGFGYVDGEPRLFGSSGILIPVRNAAGQIVAICIRADDSKAPSKYTFLTSKGRGGNGPGAPAHVPIGTPRSTDVLRIVEGHLKSDVVSSLDATPTISCGGISGYRTGIKMAKELGVKTIRWAFDADVSTKPEVAQCLVSAVDTSVKAGLAVEIERWNIEDGKGLDDLLAAGKRPEVLAGEKAIAAVAAIAKTVGVTAELPSVADEQLVERVREALNARNKSAIFKNETLLGEIASVRFRNRASFSQIREMVKEAGVSMKNFDLAIKQLLEKAAQEQPREVARGETGGFFDDLGFIYRERHTAEGPIVVEMCNFTARIVDETIRDDGAETRTVLGIEGKLKSGRPLRRAEVPADRFQKMEWVISEWGTDAIVFPNESRAVPAAIQLLSQSGLASNSRPKQCRIVYEHTGWRKIGSEWRYLHAGGAIPIHDSAGTGVATVDLNPPLSDFRLPSPATGAELMDAIRASLSVLTIGPRRVMFPLLGGVYRAVLGSCDFAISLVGQSGLGKSELAALMQQHYGPELNSRHLPGSWSSTANYIERLAFQAKDSLCVVDDFAPVGSAADIQKHRQVAERVIRSAGNNAGRGRLRQDASMRQANPPRCLILSTGEDVAGSKSVRARQLILELSPGDFDLSTLTPHQRNAADGKLATAMASFIAWIAPRYEKIKERMKRTVPSLREKASSEQQHSRTPGIIADIQFGFLLFLQFAKSSGAISDDQQSQLAEESWASLLAAAEAQEMHQKDSDPPLQFMQLLASGIVTGRFHFADADQEGPPTDQATWGWREELVGAHREWRPRGPRIGWVDDDFVYLDPQASFTEVRQYSNEQGQPISTLPATLFKMLDERGLLAARENSRETRTVRKTISGHRKAVYCIDRNILLGHAEDLTNLPITGNDGPPVDSQTPHADYFESATALPWQSPKLPQLPIGQVVELNWSGPGQVKSAPLTTNGAVKQDKNIQLVRLGRDLHPRESNTEIEEYQF